MSVVFDHLERATLATLPTPLEAGPTLAGGSRLWVKRDDLTGLGGGGNKARKLEFLCAEAVAVGAGSLVTVGAAQSNHCRMTAAAGARLGLETHLVLSGDRPDVATGNQLLSMLFGAQLHFTGAEESHWGELEIAREAVTDQLVADGLAPFAIPIGGSTAVGALGYAAAHAGRDVPDVVAIGVAKGVNIGRPDVASLANQTLSLMRSTAIVADEDVEVDTRWIGDDYAVPTEAGDAAIRWAAQHGGWLLDRTYSGKGCSGLLGLAAEGRFGSDVVFVHTGGWPALFAPGGVPR